MAEKVIGLRIQLNGLNTVITDIKTLENEIRKAKEDLKEVEIGGDIFNQLSREISQAETKLQGYKMPPGVYQRKNYLKVLVR